MREGVVITPKPQHAAVNAALAEHRVWAILGLPLGPMAAISPQVGSLDGGDTPEPHPDVGKDHLVFGDGARGRGPVVEGLAVGPNGLTPFRLTNWSDATVTMRPMDIPLAQEIGIRDAEGLDPENEEHQDILDGMFPR